MLPLAPSSPVAPVGPGAPRTPVFPRGPGLPGGPAGPCECISHMTITMRTSTCRCAHEYIVYTPYGECPVECVVMLTLISIHS